jgi:regulator of protease activity HflC (stomatin/prohibitin superfamily)
MDRHFDGLPGVPFLVLFGSLAAVGLLGLASAPTRPVDLAIFAALAVLAVLGLRGLFVVSEHDAIVHQVFGVHVGTSRRPGLRWGNPFAKRTVVSTRLQSFETPTLKVHDERGTPIEIATAVVWRIAEPARAVLAIARHDDFTRVQAEAAIRNVARRYPYDAHEGDDHELIGSAVEVSRALEAEMQGRVRQAGVEIVEARISHLAYAPEIAGAMLQPQQAAAVVAARQRIVEGAVGMVEMALDELASRKVAELDKERRAAIVSNLLVVLCSDRHAQTVVSADG